MKHALQTAAGGVRAGASPALILAALLSGYRDLIESLALALALALGR
jgi:predicted HD phosphohydrolase